MKWRHLCILLCLFALCWPLAALAADVEASLDRNHVELGETVTLNLRSQGGLAQTPEGDPIELLAAIPDLRPALESYSDEELADLFAAFDLEARYNHQERTLRLSVAVFPELAEILESERPLEAAGRSKSSIAGAGFEPATSGL